MAGPLWPSCVQTHSEGGISGRAARFPATGEFHYNDVIMNAMESQITGVSIVCSSVGPGENQRKHQSSASLTHWAGNSPVTGKFSAQNVSYAENVSIWWRHHAPVLCSECFEISTWKLVAQHSEFMFPESGLCDLLHVISLGTGDEQDIYYFWQTGLLGGLWLLLLILQRTKLITREYNMES